MDNVILPQQRGGEILQPRIRKFGTRRFHQVSYTVDVLLEAAKLLDGKGQLLAAHMLHEKAMALLAVQRRVMDREREQILARWRAEEAEGAEGVAA